MLPSEPAALAQDRTVREVVILNLFVAVQECLALATHWLADAGWDVPSAYGQVFVALAEHGIINAPLAARLAAAAGLRNLIAHRYGALDWLRIHAVASEDLDDLLEFCAVLAQQVQDGPVN